MEAYTNWYLVRDLKNIGMRSDMARRCSVIIMYIAKHNATTSSLLVTTYRQLAKTLGTTEPVIRGMMPRILKSGWIGRKTVLKNGEDKAYGYNATYTLRDITLLDTELVMSATLAESMASGIFEVGANYLSKLDSVLVHLSKLSSPSVMNQKDWAYKWSCTLRQAGIDLRNMVKDGYLIQTVQGRGVVYVLTAKGRALCR